MLDGVVGCSTKSLGCVDALFADKGAYSTLAVSAIDAVLTS